jgi:hypothetical protein
VPLCTQGFNASLLATLVAEKRRRLSKNQLPLRDYLDPESAHLLYRQVARQQVAAPDVVQFSDAETGMLANAKREVLRIRPEWKPFFGLPVLYKKLGATPPELSLSASFISFTNHYVPQQIYLGTSAFETDRRLQETVIHELSHVWMGLICELAALQTADSGKTFTLPSGTSGKDARGVIFAGMFATSVVLYLAGKQEIDGVDLQDRIDHLARYQRGCIKLIDGSPDVTDLGQGVVNLMRSALPTTANTLT